MQCSSSWLLCTWWKIRCKWSCFIPVRPQYEWFQKVNWAIGLRQSRSQLGSQVWRSLEWNGVAHPICYCSPWQWCIQNCWAIFCIFLHNSTAMDHVWTLVAKAHRVLTAYSSPGESSIQIAALHPAFSCMSQPYFPSVILWCEPMVRP